eukprot:3677099-Ditylum_brightwellii.AAC.1
MRGKILRGSPNHETGLIKPVLCLWTNAPIPPEMVDLEIAGGFLYHYVKSTNPFVVNSMHKECDIIILIPEFVQAQNVYRKK